jgi:HEPN domain-containing protein
MTAQNRIAAFFTLAERGLRSANTLFQAEQFEDSTLFVQQVVERVARALLTHAGIPFGTSHNLGQMAEALPQGHPFRDRIRSFDDLSTAVTAYRYPTASGHLKRPPDIADLRGRLDEVQLLVRDAREFVYGEGGAN